MNGRAAALAVVVSTLLCGTAEARWRIDALGGVFIPTEDVEIGDDGDTIDLGIDVGGAIVAGGGYGLGDWVDLTAHFQGNFAGLDADDSSLDVYSFTAGGRFYLMPPGRFRPWLATEIGWYRGDAQFDTFVAQVSQTDDSFGLNAGAGFDVHINQRVSLGMDVRYHNAFDALGGLQFVSTMFGVGIHFGN